jgi:two-component system, response regulator YesN
MPGYDGIELIGRAKQLNPRIDFIIISGYRHFDYAQKAIRFGVEDYLLKPLKAVEINQTLRKMIEKYNDRDQAKEREDKYSARIEHDAKKRHEQFIAGLLVTDKREGLVTEPGSQLPLSLEQINRDFDLAFKADSFQAFLVKADVHFDSLNANVRKLLTEKSVGVVRDALVAKCHSCVLYPTDHGIYGIVNFGEEHTKALRRALLAVIDGLQSQSELFDRIKVTIGLGRLSEDINEMAASISEAESAVANRLLFGAGRVIEKFGGQEAAEILNQIVTANVRSRFLQCVEILDDAEIRTTIEGIASVVATYESMTGKAIRALCDECIQILHFGLKSQNAVDGWVEDKEAELLEKLDMCSSQKDVFYLLSTFASSLIAHVAASRKSENNKPVRETQKYIQANFSRPISLESVSQRVGFNPTYFSLLFKKETGMNFLEYLTDVRIKEAKRALADPRKTIADVAADVGYSDVKHFSRLFTRSTGIHPSKYRKLYY